MKTYSPKPGDIERRWYVIDASGAILGRLASEVAAILRGKHKPMFAPHMDTGDHVIVVNAGKVEITGGKAETKVAYRHSGYPGGLTETKYGKLMAERPVFVVEKAVRGMLPKNTIGRQMLTKLQVYEGAEHPHQAQMPQRLKLGEIPKWEGLPKPKPKAEKAPEPKAPARERVTAKPAAEEAPATAAKRTTAKAPSAKRITASAKRITAKRTTAKATEPKAEAKPRARRAKKEE